MGETHSAETVEISQAALAVLLRRMSRERVEVTDETRPLYRELVAAGLMIPLHTLTGGDESAYRVTEDGVNYVASRHAASTASPSPCR
jgi:hypothetical protein